MTTVGCIKTPTVYFYQKQFLRAIMNNKHSEMLKEILRRLAKTDYVRPGEIPELELYMDQVTTFMDEHLSAMKRNEEDKILTKTMINNYAKNNLLPPPVKKKYSKDHMLTMIYIYYFKNLMAMDDIQTLLNPLTDHFFEDGGTISMERIYKEIYDMERGRLKDINQSIASMFKMAENSFPEVSDPEEADFLKIFTFISLLCFDTYMKKQIIEGILDEYPKYCSLMPEDKKKNPKKEAKKEIKKEVKKETKKDK